MLPVLFSIGPFTISSFGFFVALAFLAVVFVSWKQAKIYEISEEKILDLVLLAFFGSLIGARLVFVIFDWQFLGELPKAFLINRYPGLSFWGGVLGGSLALFLFSKRSKLQFWQIADFAAVATLLGFAIGDIGCFFSGCAYGKVSTNFLASSVVGVIGRRFPVAIFESWLFLMIFFYLWSRVVKFHFPGKIAAIFFILVGLTKFLTEFYRGDRRENFYLGDISFDHIFAVLAIILGIVIFYRRAKRNFLSDIRWLATLPLSTKERKILLSTIKKSWYNHRVNLSIKIGRLLAATAAVPKKLKRRLNVKSTPANLR